MATNKAKGFTISKRPASASANGTFRPVSIGGHTTEIMDAGSYARASKAANTVLRSATGGQLVGRRQAGETRAFDAHRKK